MGFVDGGVPAMKVSMIGERYCDQGRHVAENCNAFGFVVVILEDARREHIQGTSLFALTTRILSWLSMQAVSFQRMGDGQEYTYFPFNIYEIIPFAPEISTPS